jgi:hypothetical protein
LAAAGVIFSGCATITEHTHAYLGSPQFAPTAPQSVRLLAAAPKEPVVRLGEIVLSADGNPPREKLEQKLKAGAARLGADGVYIASDQTHIYPVEYWDCCGPATEEYWHRLVVGVAFKDK